MRQLYTLHGIFARFIVVFEGAQLRALLKKAEYAAHVTSSPRPPPPPSAAASASATLSSASVVGQGLPIWGNQNHRSRSTRPNRPQRGGPTGFLFPRPLVTGPGSARLPLSSGTFIPTVGFGDSYRHGADYDAFVLQNGFDLMDTAQLYGTEQQLGKAIAASGRKRGEIFISDKIYQKKSMGANTDRQVQAALRKLGTGYIDTYMVHHSERFIDSGETALLDQTW